LWLSTAVSFKVYLWFEMWNKILAGDKEKTNKLITYLQELLQQQQKELVEI